MFFVMSWSPLDVLCKGSEPLTNCGKHFLYFETKFFTFGTEFFCFGTEFFTCGTKFLYSEILCIYTPLRMEGLHVQVESSTDSPFQKVNTK